MATIGEILGCFESLGDNCELGIVQRFVGIEPLGFFRLNNCKMPALLQALRSDFSGIAGAGDLDLLVEPNNEYRVQVRDYNFRYHTDRFVGEVAPEALLAQQGRAIGFLLRKLREDMAAADKIFVRKGDDSRTPGQIAPLFAELRRRGPATLLWVVPEDHAHRSGTVEVLRDGLLKGFLDRLAPVAHVHQLSAAWLKLCATAHAVWRDGAPPGTRVAADMADTPSNLILFADRLDGPRWSAGPQATSSASGAVPRRFAASAIAEHVLGADAGPAPATLHQHRVPADLLAGEAYAASLHVWIPAGFAGDVVRLRAPGAVVADIAADLRQRDCWQRISSVARLPEGAAAATVALQAHARHGSFLYSTAWQFQRGDVPGPYGNGTLAPVH